ncbi:unnamed protein product [Moneuplotes crassus]|uniref:Uncharacterized protein n=1 Tax=Euplotes crassus TaxID=5936 RepID=A0AAD1Y489_EUPCR|nr:unnamed protein product [Moneuplotes crassus]
MNSVEDSHTQFQGANAGLETDIFDQIQKCTEENQQKLKQAKNLEDLVKIKISTVDNGRKDNNLFWRNLVNNNINPKKVNNRSHIQASQNSDEEVSKVNRSQMIPETASEKTDNIGSSSQHPIYSKRDSQRANKNSKLNVYTERSKAFSTVKNRRFSNKDEIMKMINKNDKRGSSSESDQENNIFGKGLADKIARLPGISYEEETQQEIKPQSKYKHSYLSSIQSIRGIEKERLNEALQNQVNKLTLINERFKQIIAPSESGVKDYGKARPTDRKPLYQQPSVTSSVKKVKNSTDDNFKLIKFCNTKNTDFLFASKDKLKAMRPRKIKLVPKNQDLTFPMDESTNSAILDEIENTLQMNRSSSEEEQDTIKYPIKVPRQRELDHEYQSIDKSEREDDPRYDHERDVDSRGSQKPARVVFKKASKEVSREERAHQMAHFEYVESGLHRTYESQKPKKKVKNNVDPKFYSQMSRKPRKRVAHSESKSMVVEGFQPGNINKFSPKRFRRFPRFTIFLNKDQENIYEKENSISLNPQFLNFLMTPERAEIVDKATAEFDEALKLLNSQNLKKFDPFDKVILSTKGIDNSILTSLRTLAKLNNSISDSFKVIHTKFAPHQLKNPSYTNKKEIPQAERSYGVHPPVDMSSIADDQMGRAFSMGPPLKGVYKHMLKAYDLVSDLPRIDENPRKGFKGGSKPAPFTNKIVNEIDESQFNMTSRQDIERNLLQSPPEQEFESLLNATNSTIMDKKKITKGRAGGFRINIVDKKRKEKPSTSSMAKHHKNDLSVNYTKGDYAHLLGEIGVRNDPPGRITHKKSNSMIPSDNSAHNSALLKGPQDTVRGLIDKMYQKEKKYIKQYFKEDYIQQNDFIFNLHKTHQLRLAKTKNPSQVTPPADTQTFGL